MTEDFLLNTSAVSTLNGWANSNIYASNATIFAAVYLGYILIICLVFFVFRRGHRRRRSLRIALLSLAAGLLALLLADLLKSLWPVGRPYAGQSNVRALFRPVDPESFPSSHAAFFGGTAFYLLARDRSWGAWFLLFALLIGISRVLAGVHYPLDILAGFALAAASAWLLLALGRKLSP